MNRIGRDNVTYFFDPNNSPAARARKGDRVEFSTRDCFNDELKTSRDLATQMDMSHMNPCTGPLYIEGTEPGSVVAIKVESIKLREWGVMTLVPHEGVLDEFCLSPETRIVDIKKNSIEFSQDIRLDLRPHIGTIGTTPLMRYPTGRTGNHGGNMDIRFVCPGSTVYFPVFKEGALLLMGDVHANMGDGEICIGIETGADVTICVDEIYRGVYLTAPMIETAESWITYADAPNGKDGVKEVCRRMVEFLCRRTNITNEDATLLISTAGDVGIAQWAEAGYNYTFYLSLPKNTFTDNRLRSFA